MMRMGIGITTTLLASALAATTATAAPTAASQSLERCQRAAQAETAKYAAQTQRALAICLQKVAQKVVKENQAGPVDVSGAVGTCLAQLHKIGRTDGNSLADKMAAKVRRFCDPADPSFAGSHAAADVLGPGAGVNQPVQAAGIGDYCGSFADGSATLTEWIDCLQAAAACQARQQVAMSFPRALEWMNLLDAQFALSTHSRVATAQPALQAAEAAIDGATDDDVPELACGPTGDAELALCEGDLDTCTMDLGTCTADLGTCSADLTACELALTGVQGQRVRTGQTQCWNASHELTPCAGTGQDGDSLTGLTVSFTDNGDGTISDSRTGLMWEKLDRNNANGIHNYSALFTWYDAFNKVKVLNGDSTGCIAANNPDACCTGAGTGTCSAFGGHTDWRLPNINELQSLVNYGGTFSPVVHAPFDTGCVGVCTTSTCSCTQSSNYWSATTRQDTPTNAWVVSFFNGSVSNFLPKPNTLYVRAVRSAS